MKRKRILLENTSQSKILFFSNKIKFVETNMQITATKVFKVGDKEFGTREEAIVATAMDILHTEIPLGIDNVIAKSGDIIKALQVVGKKK
jgi:hypothetical protein